MLFHFLFCFCSAVQLILQKCPDAANTQKNDGYTALHLAACMDHSEVAKILLKKVIHTIITPPFIIAWSLRSLKSRLGICVVSS